MTHNVDPWWKLRPAPPTPADELCACEGAPPIMLRSNLGPNPLACAACNLEVKPERVAVSAVIAESLAAWRSFHDCFYLLWLDSGEYEGWARDLLSQPTSPVNLRGLALRAEIDKTRRTYYWWFQGRGLDSAPFGCNCPICDQGLDDIGLVGRVCSECSVIRGTWP